MSGVAVVTGTSSGMGMFAAVDLARRGLRVIATMRDTSRSTRLVEEANKANVELDIRALDVVDFVGAADVVEAVLADYGQIDVLLNNAGQGSVATAEQLSMDQ